MGAAPPFVLVLDDEPIVLQLVIRILERQDLAVVSAASAAEALEALAAAEAPPAAGIVDVSLRPSGARGAVEALRAEGLDFGVVWIGGEAPMPEDQAYLDAIGGRFVPKPFAPAALFEALHAVAPALAARSD